MEGNSVVQAFWSKLLTSAFHLRSSINSSIKTFAKLQLRVKTRKTLVPAPQTWLGSTSKTLQKNLNLMSSTSLILRWETCLNTKCKKRSYINLDLRINSYLSNRIWSFPRNILWFALQLNFLGNFGRFGLLRIIGQFIIVKKRFKNDPAKTLGLLSQTAFDGFSN